MTDMPQTAPQPGDLAPDFTLPATGGGYNGGDLTLSDLRGGPVVLYFYPRDNTPGCTTEAQDFTALLPRFAATGTRILGLSTDSVKKHDNFIARRDLGVTLLSDPEAQVATLYGTWVEKNLYGRRSMGIQRASFLIDAAGRIARHWPKVRVPGHAQEVLEAAEAL